MLSPQDGAREPGRPDLNIVHSPQDRLRRRAQHSQVTSALFEHTGWPEYNTVPFDCMFPPLSPENLTARRDYLGKSMRMCEINQLLLGKWLLQHIQRGGSFRMIRWMKSMKRVRSGIAEVQRSASFKPTTLFFINAHLVHSI